MTGRSMAFTVSLWVPKVIQSETNLYIASVTAPDVRTAIETAIADARYFYRLRSGDEGYDLAQWKTEFVCHGHIVDIQADASVQAEDVTVVLDAAEQRFLLDRLHDSIMDDQIASHSEMTEIAHRVIAKLRPSSI